MIMFHISKLSFESLAFYVPYLTFFSFVILIYCVYSGKALKSNLYSSFKFEENGKKLKVLSCGDFLRFENVKSTLLLESSWLNLLEPLGNVSQRKFISVEIINKGVNLYFDNLPDRVSFEKYSASKTMGAWLGLDSMGNDVVLDLEASSSVYIDGKPGSGKSIAIKTILESYRRSINGSSVVVNVITTKPADYYGLEKDFGIVNILNPYSRNESLSDVVNRICSQFDVIENMAEFYEEKCIEIGKQVENLEEMRRQGISVPFPRYIFIFDEAKDYLNKDKSDSKEDAESKARLTTIVGNHIRRNARFLSTPIIIASQVQNENDLSIPMKSFTARMFSSTNEALSRQYTGSNILNDLSFRRGKYYLKTDDGGKTLRVAMK